MSPKYYRTLAGWREDFVLFSVDLFFFDLAQLKVELAEGQHATARRNLLYLSNPSLDANRSASKI